MIRDWEKPFFLWLTYWGETFDKILLQEEVVYVFSGMLTSQHPSSYVFNTFVDALTFCDVVVDGQATSYTRTYDLMPDYVCMSIYQLFILHSLVYKPHVFLVISVYSCFTIDLYRRTIVY